MKYYKSIFPLLIAPFFLSGIKQKINPNSITESKWSRTISNAGESPQMYISDMRIVEGNAGQRPAVVMVMISEPASRPVTVKYRTRNGTALAGSDYVAVNDSLNFAPGEILKRITVLVSGDVTVEPDEKFDMVFNKASGAILADTIGTVTIINDDFTGGSSGSNVSAGNLSIYEVRFTYTGYTSFAGSPADCPIRSKGTVVLSGLLLGSEKVAPDEDVNYTGILQMDMDIDICSSKPGPAGDDAKNCGITVFGSGAMKTDLKISFDQRGGYITTKNESGLFMKNASGSCDQSQIDEERNMIPNETIASVFNGSDLPMLTNRTLLVGRYVTSAAEGELVVEVLRKVR